MTNQESLSVFFVSFHIQISELYKPLLVLCLPQKDIPFGAGYQCCNVILLAHKFLSHIVLSL